MKKEDSSVRFLYSTAAGRAALKTVMRLHMDRIMVGFLCSKASRHIIPAYAKRNAIPLTRDVTRRYGSYRDFFLRRVPREPDMDPEHLISPCDGWMSVFDITGDASFFIKNSVYTVDDLIGDAELASRYREGTCIILRLCASDYHHYCYIDDAYQGSNHFIEGELHSVQPAACEKYPVFVLNRRSWCLMDTDNFGPVVQTEIGALVVGGITNLCENCRVHRGQDKGHFDLAGSTIVLLFEPGRIVIRKDLLEKLKTEEEVRVLQGMWIGSRADTLQPKQAYPASPEEQ